MSDPRFTRLKSDPRFRRPKTKHAKVVVDDRFKAVFAQEEKSKRSGRVDKYGRSVPEHLEKDNLKRFYHLPNDEADEQPPPLTDYARGEVLLESSDEEENEELITNNSDEDSDSLRRDSKRPVTMPELNAEVDLDENDFADLDAQAVAYTHANPDSLQQEGAPTRRLAMVNLDWDHVRALHLFKICSSLVSLASSAVSSSSQGASKKARTTKFATSNIARGKVLSVHVYPSEFGKERMAREEKEGPPPEIFKKKNNDDDAEINAQNIYDVGDEDDYDKDALRIYQLERLRYYYAIVTCDSVEAATHIYEELEGTELERSANVFDLSYVPDDMSFDDDCRDEANDDTDVTFKSVDFVTDALRHSKVKLTWDEDDPQRNQMTRRTLSKKEIEDADFRAYLASSSESESEVMNTAPKSENKKASRDKFRALLLGGNEDLPEGWDRHDDPDDVDMEITFTPGLSEQKEDETTLDKYQRKMREKRKKRKEEVKEKALVRENVDLQNRDNFFDSGSDDEGIVKGKDTKSQQKDAQGGLLDVSARPLSTPEELALLVASDDPGTETQHFNLKSVLKAEKRVRRRGKKRKNDKEEDDTEIQADFKIDVNDERFKVLHEDHQYAIDPTNPHFKKTTSMDAFLHERSRRKMGAVVNAFDTGNMPLQKEIEGKALKSLVESVKRKSIDTLSRGTKKRRKV